MEYKYEYNNDEERNAILNANTDKRLKEEQNLFEGNFLIFTDEPYFHKPSYEELENQILLLEDEKVGGVL